MKKLIYLFLTILIVACSGDSDDSGNSSNNLDGVDYFFEVELGGVINRVEGNSSYEFPNTPPYITGNVCIGSTAGVILSITDITGEDYVSGQNMRIDITFDNAQLGSNNGSLNPFALGFYITEYLESLGVGDGLLQGFVENEPMSFNDGQSEMNKISNINITDLGTPPTQNVVTVVVTGTIKGTYEGILYFSSFFGEDYDIPVPIRIEFNAARYP
jgi:hypothetical protein